jgi:glycerol uptake facilitator protein
MRHRSLPAWIAGEFLGTFLLVFFGCGVVATSTLTGAQAGLFQVAIVWGLGIALAIHLTNDLSGAHLNPAVSVAIAVWGKLPARRLPGYLVAQCCGAFAAAALLYALFGDLIAHAEAAHNVVRGAAGSEATAMLFGEFFPNPGGKSLAAAIADRGSVSLGTAFLVEATGTAVLVLVIFGCTDLRNCSRPVHFAPVMIGLTVTLLISLFAPLTMAGFNPARDFAPRVFSALAGWGMVPFTANGSGWFIVYILGPLVGGLVGGAIHRLLLRPRYAAAEAQS